MPIKRMLVLGWGALDAFFIVYYCQGAIRRGGVPYLSDAQDMIYMAQDHGGVSYALALLGMAVHMSILVSCVLLLLERQMGIYFALIQTPFRLVFLIPSISVLLLYAQLVPDYNRWLVTLLIVVSEILKGWSMWWVSRQCR